MSRANPNILLTYKEFEFNVKVQMSTKHTHKGDIKLDNNQTTL